MCGRAVRDGESVGGVPCLLEGGRGGGSGGVVCPRAGGGAEAKESQMEVLRDEHLYAVMVTDKAQENVETRASICHETGGAAAHQAHGLLLLQSQPSHCAL